MSDSEFIKLELHNVPSKMVDYVSGFLFEINAQGVSEKLNFIQTSQQYDPEIIESNKVNLQAFFLFNDFENLKSHISSSELKQFSPKLLVEKNKDWLHEWKKYYAPFHVVGNVWVYPSWEYKKVEQDQLPLLVDPGLAFGTGTHATTELCLKALYQNIESEKKYTTALDMGAGTGILSVLMKKLGVQNVLACEIDEMARDKCRENLALNKVSDVEVVGPDSLESVQSGSFSLVVANIIDGVLLKIKEQLYKLTEETLILSGILVENEKMVTDSFLNLGFELVERRAKEEWICLVLNKKN